MEADDVIDLIGLSRQERHGSSARKRIRDNRAVIDLSATAAPVAVAVRARSRRWSELRPIDDDTLQEIFAWLCRSHRHAASLSLVSVQWKRVVQSNPHWWWAAVEADAFPIAKEQVTDRLIGRIVRKYACLVRVLSVPDCINLTVTSLFSIAYSCSNLEHLDIEAVGMRVLCNVNKGVVAIAKNCPKLRVVRLSWCSSISDDTIRVLSSHCPLLQELHLGNCRKVTSRVCDLLSHCPIEGLDLSGIESMDDWALRSIATCGLTDLNISRCPLITDGGLSYLSRHAPRLRRLSISYCPCISDSGVLALRRSKGNLTRVDLRGCLRVSASAIRGLQRVCATVLHFGEKVPLSPKETCDLEESSEDLRRRRLLVAEASALRLQRRRQEKLFRSLFR